MEWNLDKKIFSVVVDNATLNDSMVKYLKSWLVDKSLLPLGGELLHVRCSAHLLNLIVQDGLAEIGGLLSKIRGTVKYLKKSAYANQNFENAINQCKLKGKRKVGLDVQNRWNSTFTMLDTALPLREAFDRLDQMGKNYKYNPSQKEWEVVVIVVHSCLKHFYNATRHFSGTKFPIANVFFPDICSIQLQLMKWEQSEHDFFRHMAGPMKEKFEKYGEECSLVLTIAVVLDPRFKMDLVEYYYRQIHGHNAEKYIQRVHSTLVDLYMDYGGKFLPSLDLWNSESVEKSSSSNDALSDFDKWYFESHSSCLHANQKLELDQYLEEQKFPRKDNFDILEWWKANCPKFPILAKMARDILVVPTTTVASESAFSVGDRVIDETRAKLLPDVVKALVTTDDWIESKKKMNFFRKRRKGKSKQMKD
nr:zinc finger BED domain-containing protein RICESLEEPER 2-like [Coffea arabica]